MSRARYIVFFDDDNVADRNCVRELLRPYEEIKPTPAIVAGRVDLEWEGDKRPSWFSYNLDQWVSKYDLGTEARELTQDDYIVTMNVAFDRETYLAAGGIREDLCRKGRMFITSGDVDLFKRMLADGMNGYYQPSAVARHFVPKARQKRWWLMKRVFGEGTTQIVFEATVYRSDRLRLWRRSYKELRGLGGNALRFPTASLRRSTSTLDLALMISMQLGRLSALSQIVLGRSKISTASE